MRETKRHKAAERVRYGIIANKVFDDFYYPKGLTVEEFVERIRPYKGVIVRQMRHLDWTDRYRKKYPDTRSGHETYGYKSLESIKNNLNYISDRFNCIFRLRWLLDLLEIDLTKLPAETPETE